MQVYTELIPPSAVTHAIAVPFLSSKARNLVVAKTSLLQIFDVKAIQKEDADGIGSNVQSKLVLVAEYPVAGTITHISSIKAQNTKSGGDALLIAVKDAKLSLVEWDQENHKISTISIHYYEGENIPTLPFGPDLSESGTILTVEPESRCAALKFGARNLAILPFRQYGDEILEGAGDDLDTDMAPPSATLKRVQSGLQEHGEKQTPYKSSFVLSLTTLDPTLTHPVDMAFLYEYREPTFGILSSVVQPSTTMLETRKDVLSYTVFTLDIEQRASTQLFSASNLPSELWKVVPLSLPVSGALLIGTNLLVHVDQSGRSFAVGVNEFAEKATEMSLTNQSDLNMMLENCEVEVLDSASGDLLLVLNDGSLATIGFKVSGRNVTGIKVTQVGADRGGNVESAPSCAAALNGGRVFVGSEDGDAVLLGWSKPGVSLSRKRSHAQMLGEDVDEEEEDEEDDDDDLYATAPEPVGRTTSGGGSSATGSYHFEVQDTLPSLGPINSTCLGRSSNTPNGQLDLLASIGRERGSRLASMSKEIRPEVINSTEFENIKNAWTLRVRTADEDTEPPYDNLLVCYDGEDTKVYEIAHDDEMHKPIYTERTGTEFGQEGETLAVSTLGNGRWVVQCRRDFIKTYDASDLSLSQIIPVMDEETDAELKVVHISFCDPYLLVIRDDSTIQLSHVDQTGEAEALENTDAIKAHRWLSGCLYSGGVFGEETTTLFLLGDDGGLHVFSLPDLHEFYTAPMLSYLPPVLSRDAPQRRLGAKETLTELLVADIGTEDVKAPYLILRTALDDLTLYEPYITDRKDWKASLRFRKVPFSYLPKFDETTMNEDDTRPTPLKGIRVGRYHAIHVPGPSSSFILKEESSPPKALGIDPRNIKAITPLHHKSCKQGFAVVDESGLRECQIPHDTEFNSGWCVQRMKIGDPAEEIRQITFHDEKQMYVVATCRDVDWYFPEEDSRHQEQDDITLRPKCPQYTLHLISAKTHKTIHSVPLPYMDTITDLKIMALEVSEHTHEQKNMLVVGTAAQRGEDMPAKGAVSVFELLEVVPDPDIPESGVNLHRISREETRGAVTAVEGFIGGFVGTAQGQKIMVRGLKEDGSCLPVAFLDAQTYTISLKSLGSTGMWLAADAWKGVWFGGFTQEPYKLTVLGKSRTRMEVIAAEFLPYEGGLYILVVDAAMDLHVLQFDPEDPKTVQGLRLLHRSTFHLGHWPTSMQLIPSSLSPPAEQQVNGTNGATNGSSPSPEAPRLNHVLLPSLSGSLSLLTPVDEPTYRRLGALQTHLASTLEHAGGLNPRGYRAIESEGVGAKGVVDGTLVQRARELGSWRQSEVLSRAGMDGWSLRSDLEVIRTGGLSYL